LRAATVSLPPTIKEARKDQPPPLAVREEREEKEPNDHITAANLITVGATIRGRLATNQDRDFFTFKTSSQSTGKIRVILRKLFNATVDIYDAVEREVAEKTEVGDTPISLSFESQPNSDYYTLVKGFFGEHGDYELVVREE
jgi:hypothetical protein